MTVVFLSAGLTAGSLSSSENTTAPPSGGTVQSKDPNQILVKKLPCGQVGDISV